MSINTAISDNLPLTRHHIRVTPHNHPLRHPVHHIRIPGLPNRADHPLLDSDVGLINSRPIHNQCIRNQQIQTLLITSPTRLPHPLPQRLPPAKLTLIPVHRHIPLHLYPQIRLAQPYQIPRRGPKHGRIRLPRHLEPHARLHLHHFLTHVLKPGLLQFSQYLLGATDIHPPTCNPIPTGDDLAPPDLHQRYRLHIPRLEAHRRPRGDVESEPNALRPIKLQPPVRLHKMIMASHLHRPVARVRHIHPYPPPSLV